MRREQKSEGERERERLYDERIDVTDVTLHRILNSQRTFFCFVKGLYDVTNKKTAL